MDQDAQVTLTREGVWRDKPFELTVKGPRELADELNEFLAASDRGALMLVPKKTMQRLLDDDAHRSRQVGELQQRGTELLEQLRIFKRLALTADQQGFVRDETKALRERLLQSYGNTPVGMDNQE